MLRLDPNGSCPGVRPTIMSLFHYVNIKWLTPLPAAGGRSRATGAGAAESRHAFWGAAASPLPGQGGKLILVPSGLEAAGASCLAATGGRINPPPGDTNCKCLGGEDERTW